MRLAALALLLIASGCKGPECNHDRIGPCPEGLYCSTYYGACRPVITWDAGPADASADTGVPDAAPECDASLGGHCYQVHDEAASWENAQLSCEIAGGHLVTIGSDAEQAIAWDLAMDVGMPVWIGATDAGSEGSWRWSTGEPFASRWASSPIAQPDNAGAGQHCAHLWPEASGLWADAACESMFPAVCEIE